MRDRKRDLCPKCGGKMREVEYSQRTVPSGTWYEIVCPRCLHRADVFKPRRRNTIR